MSIDPEDLTPGVGVRVRVEDWRELGHHIGHAASDDQAQLLDGMADALSELSASHRSAQLEYLALELLDAPGGKAALFIGELALALGYQPPREGSRS